MEKLISSSSLSTTGKASPYSRCWMEIPNSNGSSVSTLLSHTPSESTELACEHGQHVAAGACLVSDVNTGWGMRKRKFPALSISLPNNPKAKQPLFTPQA